jgi:hypothetical protein
VEQQGGASGGVERLGGIVVTTKDERWFLVMLRLKDFQWSYNSICDQKLNAILHIKMIILQISYCRH